MKRLMIVTAGPTREHLDPVRFLSNPSTGKMGFAVAAAGAAAGFDVRLVAGPVSLPTPRGVTRIDVISAREMLAAVRAQLKEAHANQKQDHQNQGTRRLAASKPNETTPIFIATAAVADWRPARCARTKLKKTEMSGTLKLVRNPDILKSVRGAIKVGFAAETDRVLAEAARKCREKHLAFIVANDVTQTGAGFGTDTNRVTLVFPESRARPTCGLRRSDLRGPHVEVWPLMTKRRVAARIIRTILKIVQCSLVDMCQPNMIN